MTSDFNRKLIAGRRIRWSDSRAAQAYASGLWVKETLVDSLQRAARETPQRVLLVDGDRRIDCRTMHMQATTLAHAMLQRAPAGSVISFMLPNWHEAAVVYLAATLAGMVINPILPSLRELELRFILQDASSRMIFVPQTIGEMDYRAMMDRVVADMTDAPDVIVVRGDAGDFMSFESLLASASAVELPHVDADAVRMIMYTSGTTGRAKGVLHTHNSLHALINQLREHWLIESGDKFLVPSPIAHIGGSIYAVECPLLLGTTAVLMERWNAADAVKLVDAEQCTHMVGATPFLEGMLTAARSLGTCLPSLKMFICGGASVPPSLVEDATAYFERAIVTRVYGSTEVPVTTVGVTQREAAEYAATTDGRAGVADIKLVNHSGARTGEGEICARGPQMLVGYLHEADEADAFDAADYFRTGDIGRWVDDCYLVVSGRAKDTIIRNGENISPKEIEDILIGHPQIAEIAIVSLPDPRTGERACAVIVPKNRPGPDVASLRTFLDARGVATFKAPEQVLITDTLPRNDAGKVLKHQLRAILAANRS
ncbi:AMP-binding protein [Povalibacter sp.]|uniref:AMP-binding protein n=1 Tax=Povalibacter sp. TaxID=1962978 RepID=UPI002F3F69BC